MIFNDLFFGFADASKEFMIEPILFEKSFYDPYGIINLHLVLNFNPRLKLITRLSLFLLN